MVPATTCGQNSRTNAVKTHEQNHRDGLDQARAQIGDEQLERAYAHGMALSLDQALDLALGKAGPAGPLPQ